MAAEYPDAIPVDLLDDVVHPDAFDIPDLTRIIEELLAALTALGARPAGDYGTVANALAQLTAITTQFGGTGYRDLRITNDASTPDTKLSITAASLDVEGQRVTNLDVVVDVTDTGAGGTAATRATNTWYYVWVGVNPTTGAATAILDATASRDTVDTSHGDLDGYTKWRRVHARRTNATGSGNFLRGTQVGDRMHYNAVEATVALTSGSADDTWVAQSVAAAVPPTSIEAYLNLADSNDATSTPTVHALSVRPAGASAGAAILNKADSTPPVIANVWVTLDEDQEFEWATSEATTNVGFGFIFGVRAYVDSL